VIDTPPSVHPIIGMAAQASDLVLVITGPYPDKRCQFFEDSMESVILRCRITSHFMIAAPKNCDPVALRGGHVPSTVKSCSRTSSD
jgi:hypothetical protein